MFQRIPQSTDYPPEALRALAPTSSGTSISHLAEDPVGVVEPVQSPVFRSALGTVVMLMPCASAAAALLALLALHLETRRR